MKLIDSKVMNLLYQEASASKRKRSHYLMHDSHSDKVQRLAIAMVKGSYVEPHYHELNHQWEMFSILEGSVRLCIFDSKRGLIEEFMLGLEYGCVSVELEPRLIHSVECISDRAFLMEVKEGPFDSRFAKVMTNL